MARQNAYDTLSGRISRDPGSPLAKDTGTSVVRNPKDPSGPSFSLAPTPAIEDFHLDSALSSPATPGPLFSLASTPHPLARPEPNPTVEVTPTRSVQGATTVHRSTPAAQDGLASDGVVDATAHAEQEAAERGYPYTESFGQRLSHHYEPFPLLPLSDSAQTMGAQPRRASLTNRKRISTLPGYKPLVSNDALDSPNDNNQQQREHAERTLSGLSGRTKPVVQPTTPRSSYPTAMAVSQLPSAILALENPTTQATHATQATQATNLGSTSSVSALNSTPMAMTSRTRVSYGVPYTNPSQPSPSGPNALPKRYDTMDSGTSTPTESKGFVRSSVRYYRTSTATLVDSRRMSLASLLQPSQPSNSFLSNQRTSMATLVAPTNQKRTDSDKEGKSATMPLSGGSGPGTGPPGKPPLEFGSHKLFDPKLRPLFQPIFRGYVPFIAILSIIVVWGIVPIFVRSLSFSSVCLVGAYGCGDDG